MMTRFITFVCWVVAALLVGPPASFAEDVYTFRVKGVIKAMPGAGLASNEILVKHEPIPEYRDENGAIVGMAAMTMPFYLAKSVSLHGIKAGDAVELVVEQHIRPKFSDQVVSIHKLDSLRRAQ